MDKKAQVNILAISLIVLVVVAVGIAIVIFTFISRSQAFVQPIDTARSYTCPTDRICYVTPTLECVDKTQDTSIENFKDIVIARTDDIDYSDGWIAYDNGFGGLDSWVQKSSIESTLSFPPSSRVIFNLPFGQRGFTSSKSCSEDLCLFVERDGGRRFWKYTKRGGADINPTPKSNCQGVEVCDREVNLDAVLFWSTWEYANLPANPPGELVLADLNNDGEAEGYSLGGQTSGEPSIEVITELNNFGIDYIFQIRGEEEYVLIDAFNRLYPLRRDDTILNDLSDFSTSDRNIIFKEFSYVCSKRLLVNGVFVGSVSHLADFPTPPEGKIAPEIRLTGGQEIEAVGDFGKVRFVGEAEFEDCDDKNVCTEDTRDIVTENCVFTPKANCCETSLDCEDGRDCTTDTCSNNQCSKREILDCCENSLECDDKTATTSDKCLDNECSFTIVPNACDTSGDCDDNDPCTDGLCTNNRCSYSENIDCCRTNSDCNDNLDCTFDECASNTCKTTEKANCCETSLDCNDNRETTSDKCIGNECIFTRIPNSCDTSGDCDDKDPCTGDLCTNNKCSYNLDSNCCRTNSECVDFNPCTINSCFSNTCSFDNIVGCCVNNNDCNDNNPTTSDQCANNKCIFTKIQDSCISDSGCFDNDDCTSDKCLNNRCSFDTISNCCVDDGECDDNDPLTQDVCIGNICENRGITGACSVDSDCKGIHQDMLCEANLCIFPTTGIYCSPTESQSSITRCNGNTKEICRRVEGLNGAFQWQFSQNCDTTGDICV